MAPSLAQNVNFRQNCRRVDTLQRKTRLSKFGGSSGREPLNQNDVAIPASRRSELANDFPYFLSVSRHHARRAVGLQVEVKWN